MNHITQPLLHTSLLGHCPSCYIRSVVFRLKLKPACLRFSNDTVLVVLDFVTSEDEDMISKITRLLI